MAICRLCREEADLQDSHLIPRSIYKLLRSDDRKNPNPVVIQDSGAITSSKQITDRLLCKNCEQRFSSHGEAFVVGNCYRKGEGFKLRDRFLTQGKLVEFEGGLFSGVPDSLASDICSCVYFAASVFWRASAHRWRFNGRTLKKNSLGPYEEQFRAFLLHRESFPPNAALFMSLSNEEEPDNIFIPPSGKRHEVCLRHKFYIPGILFVMFVGKSLPGSAAEMCLTGSQRFVSLVQTREDDWMESSIRWLAGQKPLWKK